MRTASNFIGMWMFQDLYLGFWSQVCFDDCFFMLLKRCADLNNNSFYISTHDSHLS